MDKIWIIIKREYSVRVRKKSFIIMTLITPILLGLLIFAPAYLSSVSSELEESEQKNIAVVENDEFYFSRLINSDQFRFTKIPESEVDNIKNNFSESGYFAIVDFTSEENTINFISDNKIFNYPTLLSNHQKSKVPVNTAKGPIAPIASPNNT